MKYQIGDLIGESEALPSGAISITEARYQELLTAKLQGRIINVIDNQSIIYSGSAKTVYQLDGDVILEQTMPVEDETPTYWQDTKPELPPINYTTVSRLKLKRKLQTIIEDGSDLWSQLKAMMQQVPDMWDEWLITSDVYIDDPTTIAVYTAMNKDRAWMQNVINEIHAEQN